MSEPINSEHTLQVIMTLSYSIKDPNNSVGRVPQLVLVDDCVSAPTEDLEIAVEKKPQEWEETLRWPRS